jgi:CRISPR-associated endonuclease/helicase Cas3
MESTSRTIYAHSLPDRPKSEWETLEVHATEVARLAKSFAAAFGAGDWGDLLGRWHDLGKVQPDFQRYIRNEIKNGPPHAWLGAIFALLHHSQLGQPLATAIAAHHGAMVNAKADDANGIPSGNSLAERVVNWKKDMRSFAHMLPAKSSLPPLPLAFSDKPIDLAKVELFTRFLFSALIDADRTATAQFYARHVPALTSDDQRYDDVTSLAVRLDQVIDAMPRKGSTAVIELRRSVLNACRRSAHLPLGRFSLTVPTGGGKTLSAMSFALNHAKTHCLRRVIVVIPYTSIIEQSARVYREILDRPYFNSVLEHHSNLDEQSLSEQDARGENLRKLATENWNAPVIVTTTVQFFESLLAAHGSRCRKVHNIARSVVLLDEVQTLPPKYLDTITDVLNQLTSGYGCSVVLSTATPPALKASPDSKRAGLHNVTEIIPDPSALAAVAKRVKVKWRIDRPIPYAELAGELRQHRQVLAIVHRRDDARTLAELIGDDVLHLSAAMCPAHRLHVISEVRKRLDEKRACRLVSTQLIEAGVDVDFPIVYRALAGLDSIAQSAGRCDREGKLTEAAGSPAGRMIVFRAETETPPGTPRKAFDSMEVLIKTRPIDPFEPNDSLMFFDELYRKIGSDERRVQPLRRALAFAAVSDAFKLMDDDTHPIVVPYKNDLIDGAVRILAFRDRPSRETSRALQPLSVQVRRYQLDALRAAGIVMPFDEFGRFDVICEGRQDCYHNNFGLATKTDGSLPAETSVV